MAQTTLIQVKVEKDLKKEADGLFENLGFDTSTAIRIFLKQAVRWNGLPFEVRQFIPNAETIAAMEESDRISRDPNVKTYANFSELLEEVQEEMKNEV